MNDIVKVEDQDYNIIEVNLDRFSSEDIKNCVMNIEDQPDYMREDFLKNREIHYNLDNFSTIVFHRGEKVWKFPLNEFFDKLMLWMKEN